MWILIRFFEQAGYCAYLPVDIARPHRTTAVESEIVLFERQQYLIEVGNGRAISGPKHQT